MRFAALAANLIEHHILQHPSSCLRLTQYNVALQLHRRGTCSCTSSRPRTTAVNFSFVRHVALLHFGHAVKHIIANAVQFVHQGDGLFCQTAVCGAGSCLRCTLCCETSKDIARYSILKDSDHLFATKYKTYLPTEEQLRT